MEQHGFLKNSSIWNFFFSPFLMLVNSVIMEQTQLNKLFVNNISGNINAIMSDRSSLHEFYAFLERVETKYLGHFQLRYTLQNQMNLFTLIAYSFMTTRKTTNILSFSVKN